MCFFSHFKTSLASAMLQLILLELTDVSLSVEYTAQLAQWVRTTFKEFDKQLSQLKPYNFKRLPFESLLSHSLAYSLERRKKLTGASVPPLPWCLPFPPFFCKSEEEEEDGVIQWVGTPTEKMATIFSAISLQLTQFYLFLLYEKKQPVKVDPIEAYICSHDNCRRCHSIGDISKYISSINWMNNQMARSVPQFCVYF